MIILGKYALDKGAELAQEVGPKALDTAREMFIATLDYLLNVPNGLASAASWLICSNQVG